MTTLQERITHGLKFDTIKACDATHHVGSHEDLFVDGASWQHAELTAKVVPLLVEMAEALDSEELEGEISANEGQGGLFNEGATRILERWVSSNKEIIARLEAAFPEKGNKK